MNWPIVRGDVRTLVLPITTGATRVITPGEFTWFDGTTIQRVGGAIANNVKTWVNEEMERRLAASRFCGIADYDFDSYVKFGRNITCKSGCVVRVTVTSATYYAGDLLGFKKDAGGNYLDSDCLALVQDPREAIAFVVADYTAAATEVEAMIFTAWDLDRVMSSRLLKHGPIPAGANYTAGGNLCVDACLNAGKARICRANAIVTTLTAAESTLTIKKGATGLTQTMAIVDASAMGTFHDQALAHATDLAAGNYDYDYDDDLDMVLDATPTAGDAIFWLDYYVIPHIG